MSAGLSLSAARADNFYHPPDWDPQKGSLDKFHGSHPLRERARKLDQGILIIRFEMPFNVWCDGCGSLIGKGVRFNAEKKQTGNYLSTRIWSFTMHHHCGCVIEVVTDPKSCEYILKRGAKRKEEGYEPTDAQVVALPDDEEKTRLASDPIYRLEQQAGRRVRVTDQKAQVAELMEWSRSRSGCGNDTKLNRELKREMRVRRKEEAAAEQRRKELGLPEHVKLLPESAADIAAAQRDFVARKCPATKQVTRHHILQQDIFSKASVRKSSKHSRKHSHPGVAASSKTLRKSKPR